MYGNNDGHFILPKPIDNEEKYVFELMMLCECKHIDVVIPVIDPEIYILSQYAEKFKEKGIYIIVSSKEVLDICYNKKRMNTFFKGINIAYPETYFTVSEFEKALFGGDIHFPVIIKPIYGSGSMETYEVENLEKVKILFREGLMIQRKLTGDEYGVDIFNSFDGVPLRCVIKKKISMRSGETDKSISVLDKEIEKCALKVGFNLKHIANLDCDLILEKGTIYFIDLNPRFGGGYPATHAIGVNLIEVLLQLCDQQEVKPCFHNYEENILVMKEIAVRKVTLKGSEMHIEWKR